MSGRKDANQEAVQGLAEDIATRAEPNIAMRLTGGKAVKVDSETAHRIAAETARAADRRKQEK